MSLYNHFGFKWCGGPFNGGNCLGCSSVGSGNEFVYDPYPYSYNETPNFFNQPPQPQYETYSCELCGGSPYYGFDCQTRTPLVYEKDPFPVTIKILVMTNLHFIHRVNNNSSIVVRSVKVPILALIVKPGTRLSMSLLLERDDNIEVILNEERFLSDHYTAHVTPHAYTSSRPFLATMEPTDTLLMGMRKEDFDNNSPSGEQVVDFLMENDDVAGLPRQLVKRLFDHLVKNLSSTKRMSDEPLGNDSKPISYDVTLSDPLFDFNDD
nr:hypothetical protein [Tanacetum cinerariifolium]